MDTPAIRAFCAGDLDAVIALVADALAEHGLASQRDAAARSLRAWSPGPRAGFWVAELDGAPVGTVAVVPRDPTTCELERMYVRADLRGTGLAQRLYDHAERFARAQGYDRIVLTSSRRFARAHAFYLRRGFVRTARLENDWEDDVFTKALGDGRAT